MAENVSRETAGLKVKIICALFNTFPRQTHNINREFSPGSGTRLEHEQGVYL